MSTPDLSLDPLDCGFDPRAHEMLCEIPASARCVRYQAADGQQRDAVGSIEQIAAALRAAGYLVRVAA